MVGAFLSVTGHPVRGMHQAAYLLAGVALFSQLLSLVRDRLFAASFGAGPTLDVYYAAFRIPDLLFATLASLLSLYALLPILSRLEQTQENVGVFVERTLSLFFVGIGAVAGVVFLLAPWLATLVAPGVASDELVMLMRILLLQPILLGASNILAALTQLRSRFFLYSISPLLYNIGIIGGVVFLYPHFGLAGLGWGVVAGALMHFFVQLPFLSAEIKTAAPRPLWRETFREFKEVLRLSLPRTFALSMGQVSLLLLVGLASLLSAGSIAIFMFAWNLQAVPLTIIGVSYSVAAFPTLSRLHAAGEREEFVRHIEAALRHILFWTIPATILVVVLRAQVVRAILGAGLFDWDATRLVAAALALFILSLSAQSISLLIARAYYAAGNTAKPLFFALIGVTMTVLSVFVLLFFFHSNYFFRTFLENILRVEHIAGTTVLMLALAYCLGALVQCALALRVFYRDFSLQGATLRRLAFQSFAASVLGGAAAYFTLAYTGATFDINTTVGIVLQGLLAGLVGLLATAGTLALLCNQELIEAFASLRRRIAGRAPALEPTDVS